MRSYHNGGSGEACQFLCADRARSLPATSKWSPGLRCVLQQLYRHVGKGKLGKFYLASKYVTPKRPPSWQRLSLGGISGQKINRRNKGCIWSGSPVEMRLCKDVITRQESVARHLPSIKIHIVWIKETPDGTAAEFSLMSNLPASRQEANSGKEKTC